MLTNADTLLDRSIQQTRVDECGNPNGNTCDFIICDNGGQCVEDSTTSDCFKCQCLPGYTGRICDISIANPFPCTAPCQNGGRCELISENNYGCVCPEAFTGNQCETFISPTHSCVTTPNICRNGGVCTSVGSDYVCKCTTGWNGRNCEIKETISSCDSNPCGIHGSCFQVNLTIGPAVHCNCEDQWTGKYCDVNMNVNCPIGYCLSGGTCRMNGNVPYCICPAWYTGQQCQSLVETLTTTTTMSSSVIIPNVGSCSPNSCLHEGTCFSGNNNYICICKPPWSGPICENSAMTTTPVIMTTPSLMTTITTNLLTTTSDSTVNGFCSLNPCKNGGTCVPIGTSYSCFCGLTSIYTGKNCDSTSPMTVSECPLSCAPGRCIFSGYSERPYACLWNGVMRPIDGITA